MPLLRAYRVTKDDDPVGYLGEGPGPFILATASSLGYPFLKSARFTCLDAFYEDEVAELVLREGDVDRIAQALVRAGFQVEPAEYGALFAPVEETSLGGPEAAEEEERATHPTPAPRAERSAKR